MKLKVLKNLAVCSAFCTSSFLVSQSFATDNKGDKNTDTKADVDNSATNKRVEKNDELTAETQGDGTKGDVEVTRMIRKALVKDSQLSTYAKNIKIITLNGEVTLKGPVHSEAERTRIASIAKEAAGANKKINNELDVKQK